MPDYDENYTSIPGGAPPTPIFPDELTPRAARAFHLIKTMVLYIADNSAAVSVVALRSQDAIGVTITFRVRVATADIGKLIGKHGLVAKSMRMVLRATPKTGERFALDISETGVDAAP